MNKSRAFQRFNRRSILIGLGSGAALLVAACGAPSTAPTSAPAASTGTDKSASASTSAPQAAAAPASGGSIKGQQGMLWGLQYDPHVERYKMLNDAFSKKADATFTIAPQTGDMPQKVIAAIAAGTQPDVCCIMGKTLLPLYLRKAIINVSQLFQDWKLDPKATFVGDSIGAYTYGHQIWGVPVEMNQVGYYFNVPVEDVEKLGLKDSVPPSNGKDFFESYEALFEAGKKLQTTDSSGKVKRWGLSSKGWEAQSLLGMIRSQGVQWWDESAQKFNINNEAGITALKDFVEAPVKLGIETELNQTANDAALAGKVALSRGGDAPTMQGRKLGYHFENALVPPVKGTLTDEDPLFIGEGGWGFASFTSSKNRDLAVAFLQFMASEDGQQIWSGIYNGIISPWGALNDKDNPRWGDTSRWEVQSTFRRMKYVNRTAYYGDLFGYASEIEKHTANVTSDIRQKKVSAEKGAATLQQLYQQQYKQYQADLKESKA